MQAQISITNRSRYDKYQSRFMEVLGRFRGRLLAADENPKVEEGSWEYQKVILLSFSGYRIISGVAGLA